MVKISTRSYSGWVLDYFLDKTWSYLLQTHFVLLNSKNSSISVDFCIFAQNYGNQALSLVTRSSSGWVLMTLKVLPSKSSWSQDYFTYLSCCHISHRSQVTTLFMTKFNSLLSHIHFFRVHYQDFTCSEGEGLRGKNQDFTCSNWKIYHSKSKSQ